MIDNEKCNYTMRPFILTLNVLGALVVSATGTRVLVVADEMATIVTVNYFKSNEQSTTKL